MKRVKTARQALTDLILALDAAARNNPGAWSNDPALVSTLDAARPIAVCDRFLVRADGGYVTTAGAGGGWFTGVSLERATSYSEKVAWHYAHELGGSVVPDLRPKKTKKPKKKDTK